MFTIQWRNSFNAIVRKKIPIRPVRDLTLWRAQDMWKPFWPNFRTIQKHNNTRAKRSEQTCNRSYSLWTGFLRVNGKRQSFCALLKAKKSILNSVHQIGSGSFETIPGPAFRESRGPCWYFYRLRYRIQVHHYRVLCILVYKYSAQIRPWTAHACAADCAKRTYDGASNSVP